jgi:hypothetical protein
MEIDKMSLFTKTNEQKAINYLVGSVFLTTFAPEKITK